MTTTGEFRPSTHGLHFINFWPAGTPDYTVNVPIVGQVTIGDANNGLCGGMVFTVADLYNARLQPPSHLSAPGAGSPLFDYIAARLIDSFNIPDGVLTYYYWANTPGHDTGVWPFVRLGLARMTINDQVPQIKASIDRDRPAALGLVTIASFNPGDLGNCHQVLAYGYEQTGDRLVLRVYDPNQPDNDDVTISLDTSHPEHTTAISSNVRISLPIRGFFYTDYSAVDPSSISGPAQGTVSRDAVFVSQNMPTAVVAGRTYAATVTMRNVGIQAWTPQHQYRLGSQRPPNNETWGRSRVELPGKVGPTEEVTFTFDLTAPQSELSPIQWQMLQENVEWFGERTPERVPAVPDLPVRYGTTIRLRHLSTDCNLHSHPYTYSHPGSSGQQQVTCFGGADDNDLWRVKGQHGQPPDFRSGRPVSDADVIRLEHVASRKNLHSHAGIPSPVTGQQEVTCYGRYGTGDQNDDWRVDVLGGGRWEAGTYINIVHVPTGAGLRCFPRNSHPDWTMGQLEVTGYAGRDSHNLWYAADVQAHDARFVSQSAPAGMVMGQTQTVTVVMRNLGTETWLPGNIRLGSQTPPDNHVWGPARVDLTGPVTTGQDATFSMTVTAPATPGIVTFHWRLLQEGVGWFGDDTPIQFVQVFQQAGPATVPNVVGMARPAAERAVEGKDLVARFTGATEPAEVSQQMPTGGAVVNRGSVVTMRLVKLI